MSTRKRNSRRSPNEGFLMGMLFGAFLLIITAVTIHFALEQGKKQLVSYCEAQGSAIDLARF